MEAILQNKQKICCRNVTEMLYKDYRICYDKEGFTRLSLPNLKGVN